LNNAERQDLKSLHADAAVRQEQLDNTDRQIEVYHQAYEEKIRLEARQRETESMLNQNKLSQNNLENSIGRTRGLIEDFEAETGFDDFDTFADTFKNRQRKVAQYEKQREQKVQEQKTHEEKKSRLEANRQSARESLSTTERQLGQLTPVIDRFIETHERAERAHLLDVLKSTDIDESERTVNAYHTHTEVLKGRIKDISASIESTALAAVDEEKAQLSQLDAEIENYTSKRATL